METYRDLPPIRKDLGYEWTPTALEEALEYFRKFLERCRARAFTLDVYSSAGKVYRNILIQLPEKGELWPAEDIRIQFDRDEGRQFLLTKD